MGMGNFCDSMTLAITCILLTLDTVILVASCFLPYWFKLAISPVDARYGSEAVREGYVINSGLFFLSENNYVDMISMSKVHNQRFSPYSITMGQLFYFTGTIGMAACLAGSYILACRRLASLVGEFFLASFVTLSSVCLIIGVVMTGMIFVDGEDDLWINLPMNNPNRLAARVRPQSIGMDWAFYIAIAAAVVGIGAAVVSWLEALKTCRYVEDIRDKQLRDPNYGRKEDVPYTQFTYQQSYPDTYAVTVPSHNPPQQMYYGETIPHISQTVDI